MRLLFVLLRLGCLAVPMVTASSDVSMRMLSRIEASIMGESALIDRETGRVYWEGGASNTLYESSVAPMLQPYEHGTSALLTVVMTIVLLGVLAGWLRQGMMKEEEPQQQQQWAAKGLAWALWKLPKLQNKWLVTATVILYFVESYQCNTRRFLANALSSPTELEDYIETLRHQEPVVTWTVQSFHYEWRRLVRLLEGLRTSILNGLRAPSQQQQQQQEEEDVLHVRTKNCRPMFPFTRKVISNQATMSYRYEKCIDSTMAGVWRRATASDTAPFTQIALTKLLVLSDRTTREDYFRQQSDFVTQHGRGDEFVEFSTNIQVPGFRPRALAVRSVNHVRSVRFFRSHLFWIFTMFGMTLPYRIWFQRHCDFLRVTVVKETSTSSTSGLSSYYRKWLPSSATIRPYVSSTTDDTQFRSFMQGRSLFRSDSHVPQTTEALHDSTKAANTSSDKTQPVLSQDETSTVSNKP